MRPDGLINVVPAAILAPDPYTIECVHGCIGGHRLTNEIR